MDPLANPTWLRSRTTLLALQRRLSFFVRRHCYSVYFGNNKMIEISTNSKTFKTLRPGDPDFVMSSGILMAPRAGLEISNNCPDRYASVIAECINQGWLKPVAHMRDSEYTWELLQK